MQRGFVYAMDVWKKVINLPVVGQECKKRHPAVLHKETEDWEADANFRGQKGKNSTSEDASQAREIVQEQA